MFSIKKKKKKKKKKPLLYEKWYFLAYTPIRYEKENKNSWTFVL